MRKRTNNHHHAYLRLDFLSVDLLQWSSRSQTALPSCMGQATYLLFLALFNRMLLNWKTRVRLQRKESVIYVENLHWGPCCVSPFLPPLPLWNHYTKEIKWESVELFKEFTMEKEADHIVPCEKRISKHCSLLKNSLRGIKSPFHKVILTVAHCLLTAQHLNPNTEKDWVIVSKEEPCRGLASVFPW